MEGTKILLIFCVCLYPSKASNLEGKTIFYDKNASHRPEVGKEVFYVIRDIDVVVILWS